MKVIPQIWRRLKWTNFLGLTIAGIINAIGVCLLLSPVNVYDGGFSGTSVLLDKQIPGELSLQFLFLIVLNFPFFLIGRNRC